MDKALQNVLIKLGLTDKEAKVYLACTSLGTSVVSEIAKSAGINRVTTYDVLEKLKQKGLVTHFTKQKTKFFTSMEPETLLAEFENRVNELKLALPKLKDLQGETEQPANLHFEGIEEVKKVYTEALKSKDTILIFSNKEEALKHWPEYEKQFEKKAKLKKVEGQNFGFEVEILVFDNKVATIAYGNEIVANILKNEIIVDSYKSLFTLLYHNKDRENPARDQLLQPIKESDLQKQEAPAKPKAEKEENLSLF